MNNLGHGDIVHVSWNTADTSLTTLTCECTRLPIERLPDYTRVRVMGNDMFAYYRHGYRDGRKPDPDFIAFEDGEVIERDRLPIDFRIEIVSIPKPSEYLDKRAYEHVNGRGSWDKR